MRAVNLLPREAVVAVGRPQIPKAVPIAAAALVPVVAIGLVVTGYHGAHSVVSEKQRELAAVQLELSKVEAAQPKVAVPTIDTAALIQDRSARLAALQTALGKEVPWDTALTDIARVLPTGVWLTNLDAKTPAPADSTAVPSTSPNAPSTFSMQGMALSQDDVAALLARLQLLPSLSSVTLSSVAQTSVGTKQIVSFQIAGAVTAPASATPTPPATP